MDSYTLVIILAGILVLIFIFINLRPLSEDEVIKLGMKRRGKTIQEYFSFNKREVNVDKDFKRKMNPRGQFYNINQRLSNFPATAAALLKYKKHEWAIVGFEKNKDVNQIWCNKGPDRTTVSISISFDNLVRVAKRMGANSILTFHNHPNPNPQQYSMTKPSKQDLSTAKTRSERCNFNGINLLSFVCERGRHYRYTLSSADGFFPLSRFITNINELNGRSRMKNFGLHMELIF